MASRIKPGYVENGYVYLGGAYDDPNNWAKDSPNATPFVFSEPPAPGLLNSLYTGAKHGLVDQTAQAAAGLTAMGADAAGKDRKSTRLNSSHSQQSRMPSSA